MRKGGMNEGAASIARVARIADHVADDLEACAEACRHSPTTEEIRQVLTDFRRVASRLWALTVRPFA